MKGEDRSCPFMILFSNLFSLPSLGRVKTLTLHTDFPSRFFSPIKMTGLYPGSPKCHITGMTCG